jgi:hypothetical protein
VSVSLYLASCSPAISSPNWYTAEAANRSGGAAEQPFDPHGACHSDGAPKSLAGSGLQVACGKLFGDMFAVMPGCCSSTKVSPRCSVRTLVGFGVNLGRHGLAGSDAVHAHHQFQIHTVAFRSTRFPASAIAAGQRTDRILRRHLSGAFSELSDNLCIGIPGLSLSREKLCRRIHHHFLLRLGH